MTNIIARCAAKKILGARLVKEKIIKNKLKERINLQNKSKPAPKPAPAEEAE